MPFHPSSDYWIEIPSGRYRVGLTRDEAHALAKQGAAWLTKQGPEFSLNDAKLLSRAAELAGETGNAAWVEKYLLAHHPAREIELRSFAIARRPITNREFRAFMADTGETQVPEAWQRGGDVGADNSRDDLPAHGVGWWQAEAIAKWANARFPFEDEWERAVRGAPHWLFPWGNDLLPAGEHILDEGYRTTLPAKTTRSPDGLEGAGCASEEWCADGWHETADPTAWDDKPSPAWWHVVRGSGSSKRIVPSALSRSAIGFGYNDETASVRLVRGDGRVMPATDVPRNELAMAQARAFESCVLQVAYKALEKSPMTREHTLSPDWSGHAKNDPGALKLSLSVRRGVPTVRSGLRADPNVWVDGIALLAFTRETIRRIPQEHGVFLFVPQYRLAEDGVHARPTSAFRMAFDKSFHRFENRFRPNEIDTRVENLTPDIVARAVLDAFQYYEIHADSDRSPFKS